MTREELLVERITYITKFALGEELNNMLGIEVDKDFNEAILQASIKAAKVGMKFADSHPRWISVEDELPPQGECVLVTNGESYWQNLYSHKDAGYRVSMGHRPNPNGYIIVDGEKLYAKTYDGWNQPDVEWWLDLDLPFNKD